jgi:Flp pilus assembly pilin Flp
MKVETPDPGLVEYLLVVVVVALVVMAVLATMGGAIGNAWSTLATAR